MADVEIYRSNSESLVPNGNGQPGHRPLDDLLDKEQLSPQRRSADNRQSRLAADATASRSHRSSPAASIAVTISPRDSPEFYATSPLAELLRTPPSRNDRQRRMNVEDTQHQVAELENHRKAVQQLTDKILGLNAKRLDLEKENAELRRQLDTYLYTTKPNFEIDDGEPLEATELKRRYAIVKGKLQRQADDLKDYRDKVLELQKKLIEKNETEKDYLTKADTEMRRRVEDQQLIHQLRTKREQIANFEGLYLKQQRVIEKLERLVNTQNSRADNHDDRVIEVLREENKLLRNQLGELTAHNISERRNAAKARVPDDEFLRLQQKLEVAEQRVKSLEKQLDENARRWSKEKSDLRMRLSEARYGLNLPSSPMYHLSPLPGLGTAADRDRDHISGDYRARRASPTSSPRRPTYLTKQAYGWP